MATKLLKINNITRNHSGEITVLDYELIYEVKIERSSSDYVKNSYTPKAGDKLFFTKDCSVPRFKVKTLCDKYDISVTRARDKADAIFISDNFIDSYTEHVWGYSCSKDDFLNHIKKTPFSYDLKVLDMLKFINENGIEKMWMGYVDTDKFDINGFELDVESISIKHCTQEGFNVLRDLYISNNTYIQDDIIKLLNQDVIIDIEMYKQLDIMFESNNSSDIKLAMEAISNSNFEKSAPYILLLLKNNGSNMWNSGFRNHINFKSLIEFFGLHRRRGYTNLSLDNIIDVLKEKNLLTKENIDIFMPLAFEEIKENSNYDHFKISKIKFVEDPLKEDSEDDEEVLNIEDEAPIF